MPSDEHADQAITRRTALTRFAALTGSVAAASIFPAEAVWAAAPQGLDARRQQVVRALVQALNGNGPIDVSRKDFVAELRRRYEAALPETRVAIDTLLDALEVAPTGPSFSARTAAQRRALLRSWLTAVEPADALMEKPRPSDAKAPTSLEGSIEEMKRVVRDQLQRVPESQKQIDPATGLIRYEPPEVPTAPITDGKGATGTPVRLRRALAYNALQLAQSFFVEDTRQLNAEVFV